MKNILCIITITIVLATIGCGRPDCVNSNPLLKSNDPGSKIYNEALLTQLAADNQHITYLFDRLEEREGMEYIHADVISDSLCAKAVFTVLENKSGLTDLILAKGIGYSGAELQNLKFNVYRDSTRTELMLESVDAVID